MITLRRGHLYVSEEDDYRVVSGSSAPPIRRTSSGIWT